jgi:hypothetical protein
MTSRPRFIRSGFRSFIGILVKPQSAINRRMLTLSAALLALVGMPILADSPASEQPYAVVSPGGQFVFVMLPGTRSGRDSPIGRALRLEPNGEFVTLW